MLSKNTASFLLGITVFIILPTIFYIQNPGTALITYYLVVGAFFYVAFMQYIEAFGSFLPTEAKKQKNLKKSITLIVPCYLPVDGGIVEETVQYLKKLKYGGKKEVMVVYDPPGSKDPVLNRLKKLGAKVIPNEDEKKAGALNTALRHTDTEVCAIVDSDHRPKNLERAVEELYRHPGNVCLQGRCYERGKMNWFLRLVSLGIDCIYLVSHPGRSKTEGVPIFCGSNGYWKTEELKKLGFDKHMLTEDIDLSVRTLLVSKKIVYDVKVPSSELPPSTFKAWWNQRLRWSQGWMQVGKKHFFRVLGSDLPLPSKLNGFIVFCIGPYLPLLVSQIIPLMISDFFTGVLPKTPLIYWIAINNFLVIPIISLAAYLHLMGEKRDLKDVVLSVVLSIPFVLLGFMQSMQALANEIIGHKKWLVTPKK